MDVGTLFDVRDRIALVTGGSRGIGAMIAEGLVRAGAKVWICARHASEVESTVSRLSQFGECRGFAADLSSAEGVDAAAAVLDGQLSKLDILVNNAGTAWVAPIDEFPRSGFDKIVNLNLTAPFDLARRLLPLLRSAATIEHPARIINIASIDGLRPPSRPSFSYSASKAGMIMLTRHMAKYLAMDRITVNAIAPGIFESKMTAFWFDKDHPAHEPLPPFPLGERVGRPEDIVGAVLYLASRAGSHVTGATLPVAGGEATID
jgi:NAD(P)-dependent dehydrogenase (short-subunit alcohol dehydrogenase family)